MSSIASRTKNASLNTLWAMISQGIIVFLGLFSRKVFLDYLGAELLGVNSLFTDVLLLFSFADLGFGTAIMFSMYKPIADNDESKIRSLLVFYREIYNYVIGALIVISLLFIPFLYSVKTDIDIHELIIYYAIFQVNNIVQYVWAYRESYVVASQNERAITKLNLYFQVVTTLILMVSVVLFQNFYIYLLISVAMNIFKKFWVNAYIIKKYPITIITGVPNIDKQEKKGIIKKSIALLITKIGNLLINQTDSLVVSVMINVTQWGLASNYLVIKRSIFAITEKIYSGLLPSMGNLVASGDKEREFKVFLKYDFLNAWMHTFCFIGFVCLSSPFVALFFGEDVLLSNTFVFVFFLAALFDGLRSPVSVLREASGSYEVDKWYTMVAAAVNLGTSLPLAYFFGLEGVFIGTICAMSVLHIARSIVLFRINDYNCTAGKYLYLVFSHILIAIALLIPSYFTAEFLSGISDNIYISFIIRLLVIGIVPNVLWVLIYCRNQQLVSVKQMITNKLK